VSKSEIKITCDSCKDDITYTSFETEYNIKVISGIRGYFPDSNFVYSMSKSRPIEKDLDFCGTACMKKWVETNL
jgi:hypothetical protein